MYKSLNAAASGVKEIYQTSQEKGRKVMGGKERKSGMVGAGCRHWEGCEGSPQNHTESQKSAAFWVNLRCFSIPAFHSTPAALSGAA